MINNNEWDFETPPIVIIGEGSLFWKSFCTKEAPAEEVVRLANKHHHPRTTRGWTWPSDEDYQTWCDVNNKKWGIKNPFTVEELKNGIICKNRPDTHRHYMLQM